MINRYCDMTEKEKAEAEQALWDSQPKSVHRKYQYKRYLLVKARMPEVSARKITERFYLLKAGAVADPLWRAIDEGKISTTIARKILREARRRSADSDLVADLVIEGIKNYCETRRVCFRSEADKALTNGLKKIVDDFTSYTLRHLPEDSQSREELIRELGVDLRTTYEEFYRRVRSINALPREELPKTKLTWRRVRDAFDTLGLVPPRKGHPADLAEVTRQKRRLVRQYHPDLTGNENLREAYQSVIKAYETIKQYNGDINE